LRALTCSALPHLLLHSPKIRRGKEVKEKERKGKLRRKGRKGGEKKEGERGDVKKCVPIYVHIICICTHIFAYLYV